MKNSTIKPRVAGLPTPGIAVDDAGKRKTRLCHRLMAASESLPRAVWPCSRTKRKTTIKPHGPGTPTPGVAVKDAGKYMTRIPQRLMTASESLPTAARPCSRTKKRSTVEIRGSGKPGLGLAVDDAGKQMTRLIPSRPEGGIGVAADSGAAL